MILIRLGALVLLSGLLAPAQDFKDLEKKVTQFKLPNGMRFIVAERHDAPTIAVRMVVGAGSAEDPGGASGLAHLFQRIAFQGTETIGTRDGAAEKKALDAVEEAYERLSAERNKRPHPDEVKILSLQLEVQKALSQAQSYSSNDEFLHAFDSAGVTGVAADITTDFTRFQATVPSNKAEFWFLMESQWLLRPVFRNFYQERDRAVEDYRNAVESNPEARLLQALGAAAFTAHPYHHQPAGWLGDVAELRQSDARQFFDRYYAPGNITIAMAGDIGPEEARRLAERYFGPIAARAAPPAVRSQEPPQTGPRTVVLEVASQPSVALGYKRPDEYDRDNSTLDIIAKILSGGHGGWLNRELMDEKRIVNSVQARATFPGGRYPHLFVVVAVAAAGHTAEETENGITAVIARLQNEKVDQATLDRAKAQARSELARRLSDNAGIATMLATSEATRGNWRALVNDFDALGKVTADQVQIAALKYFVFARRTAAYLVPPAAAKGGGL